MTTRVTVVVATFNSGSAINALVDSLDRQSMPTEDFDVVYVDDGSTDGTDERLRRLAATRPNVKTTRIPNSGWPGKPRNIGLDLAEGEYVFFADHDDFFGDEALERMCDYAKANSSDVLVARETRVGRQPLAPPLFAKNRPRVDMSWSPLIGLLTPHKLFRRAFLVEHGLRFPEGKRRLEDHALVLPAFFAADVISVLADYPCYFWVFRGEASNHSQGIDPETYYPYLIEVLDLVEAKTEPGPQRDAMMARWYSGKVLGFIERNTAKPEPEKQLELLAITGELARTRFTASDKYLSPVRRVLSALLRAGDNEHLVPLGQALARLSADPVVRSAHWREGALHLDVTLTLRYADGAPVSFRRKGERILWIPPVETGEHVDESMLDMTDVLAGAVVVATVRHRELGIANALKGESTQSLTEGPDGRLTLSFAHHAVVDVRSGERGAPLRPGRWQLRIAASAFGLYATDPLPGCSPLPPPALVDGTPVVPFVTRAGNLALAVDVPQVSLVAGSLPRPEDVQVTPGVSGTRLVIDLPKVHVAGDGERRCALRIGKLPVPGRLVADGGTGRVGIESWLSAVPGRHRLSVELDGKVTPLRLEAVVAQNGRVQIGRPRSKKAGPRPPVSYKRLRAVARHVPGLRTAYRAVRRLAATPTSAPAPKPARRGTQGRNEEPVRWEHER